MRAGRSESGQGSCGGRHANAVASACQLRSALAARLAARLNSSLASLASPASSALASRPSPPACQPRMNRLPVCLHVNYVQLRPREQSAAMKTARQVGREGPGDIPPTLIRAVVAPIAAATGMLGTIKAPSQGRAVPSTVPASAAVPAPTKAYFFPGG